MNLRRPLAIVLAIVFSLSFALGAHAQDTPDKRAKAEIAFTKGKGHFKAGNFADALNAFQNAYQAFPTPDIAWNVARCFEELGQYHNAISSFELFLAIEGITEAEREGADNKINTLKSLIEKWRDDAFAVQKAIDANQTRDAIPRWRRLLLTPVETKRLTALSLNLAKAFDAADDPQFALTLLREFLLVPNLSEDETAKAVSLQSSIQAKLDAAEREKDRRSQAAKPSPALSITGWSLIGLGVVSTGFGAYMATEVSRLNDESDTAAKDFNLTRSKLDTLAADTESAALFQYIGFGVGATSLIGGGILLLLNASTTETNTEPQSWRLQTDGQTVSVQTRW